MQKRTFFKLAQTWILTVAILVSVFAPALGTGVFAAADPETITDGEIVANNYELSEAEKALLSSGLLTGKEHSYSVPGADDDLISVDTDSKTVTIESYEETAGYEWKPISAKIMVGAEVKETVALDSNGKGTYKYDGNAFSVVAEFALDIEVDEDTQSLLLNAPSYLVDGLGNLADVADTSSNLSVIEQAMPEMVKLATTGMVVFMYGQYITVTFSTEESKTSTLALNEQMTANGGKLDLTVMIEEYKNAESKVQYLLENGAEMKAKAAETQGHVANILTAAFWSLIDSVDQSTYAVLFMLRDNLKNCNTALTAVCAEPWEATKVDFVKEGLTAAEYVAIDGMVARILKPSDVSQMEIRNPLRVSVTSIQYNMSMFDVAVEVVLMLTDSTSEEVKYNEYDRMSTTVTLAENATAAEILAEVEASGIEAAAKAKWGAAYVDGKFDVVTDTLPGALVEDITYVITYTPKMFDIAFDYDEIGTVSYPYGYKFSLANHSDNTKAYDYTINGKYYAQGSVYGVVDNATVTRKEGKAYVNSDLYTIVSENFLGDKSTSILNSGALRGNAAVNVRYPDNSNGIVTLTGNVLKAEPYVASYEGLSWVPYRYHLSDGSSELFNGLNEVEITKDFDNVTVEYRLDLTNFNADEILGIANLPNTLESDAEAQLKALNRISAQESNLEILNSTMVNILDGLIESSTLNDDPEIDARLKANFGDVLASIGENCMGASNLYLYDIVAAYTSASDGLLYYYQDHQRIQSEIGIFAGYMTQMLGDDEGISSEVKIAALERLMRSLPSNIVSPDQVDNYISKLTTLESTMNEVQAGLTAPNALIDLESAKLGTLTAAIQAAGDTDSFDALSEYAHLTDSKIVMTAENKVAITVTLNFPGKTPVTVVSDTVFGIATIEKNLVDALKEKVSAQIASAGIDAKYYDTDYANTVFDSMVGKIAKDLESTAYEFSWTYKIFDVEVPGTAVQQVSKVDNVISLPAHSDPAYRYDYYINGKKVANGNYTLTESDLDKIAAGEFTVARETVYVLREDLVNYVNGLNASIGSDDAVFALKEESEGNFSIVLKMNGSNVGALSASAQGIVKGIVSGSYPYVGIGDEAFLNEGKLYLQSAVDALLNSGFGFDTIVEVVDKDGNVNNMTLNGTILTDKNLASLGGKLLATTIQLGSEADNTVNVPLYVTLGSVPAEFTQVRNFIDTSLKDGVDLVCADGVANISLNLPEKLYEAFLAMLLITENININDIDAVNGEIAVGFVNDMLIPLFKGDVTLETFENTIARFGRNVALSSRRGAESLFSMIKSFYTGAEFTYDDVSGTATGVISIASFIESMDIGVLGDMIAEKETGIALSLKIALEDLGNEYEALYVDVAADGITNKIGLTADLSSKLSKISGKAAIVLLSDIDDDITVGTTTLLNLNGFSVNGTLTANGKTVVVDSCMEEGKYSTISGLSGNITLTAGKYDADVSEFIKNGYEQDDTGVVVNKFFTFAEDEDGNIVVSLNAGVINTDEMPDLVGLAADIVCELLFNGYTGNYLELDGNTIYDITVADLVGMYSGSNRLDSVINEVMGMIDTADLSKFINTVLDDAMNFRAISKAINDDAPIFEYSMATKPWKVELEHVTEEDYITGNIISGNEATERMLRIELVGEDADKEYFADLFAEFGNTIVSDVNVNLAHSKENFDILLSADIDANVIVDWTNPDYAVMFSIIVADGLGSSANENLIKGIRYYYENDSTDVLNRAFNALTTSQVISALKNLARGDSFTAMVASLGLDDVVSDSVTTLEGLFDKIGKVLAFAVRKAELVGGNRTLASFLDSDGIYSVAREDVERFYTRNLFRGYTVSADVAVSEFNVGMKLFGEGIVTPIDYSELEKQIERAQSLNEDDYTAETWTVLEAALADAIAARDAIVQAEVDAAAQALAAAIDALEEKPVVPAIDYSELEKQIERAQALNEDDYTAETWADLEKALADAIAAKNATTQAEVDAAAQALAAAIDALKEKPVVPAIDYSELEKQIERAQALNEDDYTAETWAVLEAALADAIAAKNATTQAEVDAAAQALAAAIAALKEKPVVPAIDYSELEKQIAIAQSLKEDDYTAETWTDLEKALADAIAAKNATTQAEVDAAAQALAAAIAALKEKPVVPVVDYTELNAQIEAAQALNGDIYTNASWEAVQVALANAIAARSSVDQAEVDAAAAALKAAVAALVICGDVTSDGIVNILDAISIAQKMVRIEPEKYNEAAADYNKDGIINILDAIAIAKTVVA